MYRILTSGGYVLMREEHFEKLQACYQVTEGRQMEHHIADDGTGFYSIDPE